MDKRCFGLRYFLMLALVVLAGPAAVGMKAGPTESLVGKWTAQSATIKRAGRPDESKTHPPNELTTEFKEDRTFVSVDRAHGEPVSVRGVYELTGEHTLKETIADADGPKSFVEKVRGKTVAMEYTLSGNSLTLVSRFGGRDDKGAGQSEVIFVRVAP
jgi:hypothetical protein